VWRARGEEREEEERRGRCRGGRGRRQKERTLRQHEREVCVCARVCSRETKKTKGESWKKQDERECNLERGETGGRGVCV
jgi:hypothetical protein